MPDPYLSTIAAVERIGLGLVIADALRYRTTNVIAAIAAPS
jgi:hypothetical protein